MDLWWAAAEKNRKIGLCGIHHDQQRPQKVRVQPPWPSLPQTVPTLITQGRERQREDPRALRRPSFCEEKGVSPAFWLGRPAWSWTFTTSSLECQKWKQTSSLSTRSFSRPTVLGPTTALVLRKDFPLHKKILNKSLLIFREVTLPKFVTWLLQWQVCYGNDFLTAGTQHCACFTNSLLRIFQPSANRKASPCQVFWKLINLPP